MKKIIRSKQVGQAGFADVITADLGWTRTHGGDAHATGNDDHLVQAG